VLAAHGERGGEGANARTFRVVEELQARLGGTSVAAGFFKARPSVEQAIEGVARRGVDQVIVAPLLMAGGYFAEVVLPRALERARAWATVSVVPPVGAEPAMRRVALERARIKAREAGWTRPSVLVVGHGTRAYQASRTTSENAARFIAAAGDFARVGCAFLEDAPSVAQALAELPRPVVVIPYLWSAGRHALDDLGAFAAHGVAVDRALGEDPAVPEVLIASIVRTGAAGRAANTVRPLPASVR
jgi:sirohydrochlorin ferrochelatase